MAVPNGLSADSNKRRMGPANDDRPKRRRTAAACTQCRDRKRKCDGTRPVCGACSTKTKGEQNCTWDPDKAGKFDSGYVMSLQTRIHQLESMLARSTSSPGPNHPENQGMACERRAPESPARPPAVLGPSPLIVVGDSPHSEPTNSHQATSSLCRDAPSRPQASGEPSTDAARVEEPVPRAPGTSSFLADIAPPTGGLSCLNATALDNDLDNAEEDEAGVDAMGTIASISAHEGSTTRTLAPHGAYFGPSSTLSFTKHIQAALLSTNGPNVLDSTTNERFREQGYSRTFKKANTQLFGHRNYVIPTRDLGDDLLYSYWNHVHPIYPYLFKSAFNLRYQKLWSVSTEKSPYRTFSNSTSMPKGHVEVEGYYCNEPIFFCILNIVFALGAQYSTKVEPGERVETGKVFFQRAKEFINLDSLEHGEVTLVQALLLMGHYLQSTGWSSMCWNVVGLVVRISQSIGLDKPVRKHHSHGEMSRLDEEIRKRLWGGCILLDRVTSMMFGRQLMLHPTSVRNTSLPDCIEEEELMGIGAMPALQSPNEPSSIAFFAQAVKLCQLMGEVLNAIYDPGTSIADSMESGTNTNARLGPILSLTDKIKTGNMHEILQLDAELTKWRDDLPWFLQFSAYKSVSTDNPIQDKMPRELFPTLRRQAKILQARFLHAKILLSRPALEVLLSKAHDFKSAYSSADALPVVLNQMMLEKISKHCIEAAQDLTFLVYDSLMSGDVTLPAWWYNVFYLHTTATIFVAQRLCPSLMPTEADDQWRLCWDKCLHGLHIYKSQSVVARRCFRVLDLINKQLLRTRDYVPTLSTCVETSVNSGYEQSHVQKSQAIDPTGSEHLGDPDLRFAGGSRPSHNLTLDAQDMEWLANIPFDPNIDIGTSPTGWLDGISEDFDPFFLTQS